MPNVETERKTGKNAFQEMFSIVQLVENTRLARIYTYLFKEGPAVVDDLCTNLGIPEATAYQDVKELVEIGVLDKENESRPYRYRARPLGLTLGLGDELTEVRPAFIAAVAQREENQNIGLYIERHGPAGLATALEYAEDYRDGSVNARIMAREQDLTPLEAETILQELVDVIRSLGHDDG